MWHGINKDVCHGAKTFKVRQMSKIANHSESGVSTFPQPHCHFGHLHLHIDIIGPLSPSEVARWFVTILPLPMADASASSVPKHSLPVGSAALVSWMTSHLIRTQSFISGLWTTFVCLMGTNLNTMMICSSTANGIIECLHQSLKVALMVSCSGPNLKSQLP